MTKVSLDIYAEKIAHILRKDSLAILFKLRERNCRFKELPGNSFTKSNRLKELRFAGLIEPVILNQSSGDRTVVGYRLTEKGGRVLEQLDGLFRVL